jgi:hypothetical protein
MAVGSRLEVRIYDNNLSSPTLLQELTDRVSQLAFTTQLNGGFGQCQFLIGMRVQDAWGWLSHEGKKGYHFNRVTVHEGQTLVWEGRVASITLQVSNNEQAVRVHAEGYWASCADQYYTATGNTDWTASSGHQVHDIIKEMLTEECPDINSDQTNIADTTRDLVGLDLTAKAYPQTRINELLRMSDSDNSVWNFAIWDDRKPYLTKRAVTQVDWYVWLEDLQNLKLEQSATELRNAVLPFVGTTEGTTVTNATSLALYPRREVKLTLPTGANANTQADMATMESTERGFPRQSQSFRISGSVYKVAGASGGQLVELPKWRMRAGDVVRIQDLVPLTASTPELDDVRTFFIMDTQYDGNADVMRIQPDRKALTMSRAIRRIEIQAGIER